MTHEMQSLKGSTMHEKAANFWISPEVEEKCLADQIEEMKRTYQEFKSVNMICIAAGYLQRFYLNESIFIYNPKEISFACLFIAAKIEEMSYTPENFCKFLKKDPAELKLV